MGSIYLSSENKLKLFHMKTALLKRILACCCVLSMLMLPRFAEAQSPAKSMAFNSEALWANYNHKAFFDGLRQSLSLDEETFTGFRNYLEWKYCPQDRTEFFTKAGKGILNPMNVNAYFDQLRNKYFGLFPEYVTYQKTQSRSENQLSASAPNQPLVTCTQPCTNPGFETGNFTAWIQQDGTSSSTAPGGVILAAGTTQSSITSPGPDPIVGAALPMVFPGGGNFSALVGDGAVSGARAGAISTTFLVTPNNTNFTYAYAVVLQDGGHLPSQQPFFQAVLRDQNGNIPPCGSYYVTAGPNIPNFFETSPGSTIWYRPWTSVFVDLTPYIGQCMTIEFISRDCTLGAHYGYAYVDASCSQAMVITSSPAVCGGSTVTLTAPPGAASYSWSGPGIVGSNTGQVITVNVAGTYSVVMTSSQGGCTSTLSITLTSFVQRPFAIFSAPAVCSGNATQFTDHSTGAVTINHWEWDFDGDGIVDDSTQNPAHTFPGPGIYPVHLQINSPPCSADTTINVLVIATPVASFTFSPACMNAATVFTNTSTGNPNTFSWDFGDGHQSTTQNPAHIYTTTGIFTVTLISTFNPGGCTNSATQVVSVYPLPVPSFTAAAVCNEQTTVFMNNSTINAPDSIRTTAWDFGDPISGNYNSSTLVNPTHMFSTAGTFNVMLTLTSNHGCVNNVIVPVEVDALPEASFSNTSVCLNSPVVFTDMSTIASNTSTINHWIWNFGDAGVSGLQNPTHTYATAGTYTASLIVFSDKGCSDTITKQVVVSALPVVKFTGDSLMHCTPWCVNFTDSSTVSGGNISTWTWNFGDGTLPLVQTVHGPERHCYNVPGTYSVTLTVTSDQGCSSTLVRPNYVTTWPIPEAAFASNPTVTSVENPVVNFTDHSTGANTWLWTFGDGDTTNAHITNPIHSYPSDNPGTYTVQLIVTNRFGCSDSSTAQIVVGSDFDFYIPNCFTPNGDGKNDIFFGYGVGIIQYRLQIFDRWGNFIYQSNDLYSGWDGKVQGSSVMCQEDVYVWKVDLMDVFNKKHNYIGHVSLVR
jgi:gliding motility-associated-like protein